MIGVALETLYSGLGLARAALALRQPATGLMRMRISPGDPKPALSFRADAAADLFSAAVLRAADVRIANTETEKVKARLPAWFVRGFGATRSFLPMPLAVGGRIFGFLYAGLPLRRASSTPGLLYAGPPLRRASSMPTGAWPTKPGSRAKN